MRSITCLPEDVAFYANVPVVAYHVDITCFYHPGL